MCFFPSVIETPHLLHGSVIQFIITSFERESKQVVGHRHCNFKAILPLDTGIGTKENQMM